MSQASSPATSPAPQQQPPAITCSSTGLERTQCPADTSAGVALVPNGLGTGATVWWMPTTHEFGPNGSYGDWDDHEKLATRFGVSTARNREKKVELYGVTSRIFGDKDAGFGNSRKFTFGGNYYWFDSPNVRTNVQFMNIDRSPVSSVFGFYVGGQKGNTVSVATSFYF